MTVETTMTDGARGRVIPGVTTAMIRTDEEVVIGAVIGAVIGRGEGGVTARGQSGLTRSAGLWRRL